MLQFIARGPPKPHVLLGGLLGEVVGSRVCETRVEGSDNQAGYTVLAVSNGGPTVGVDGTIDRQPACQGVQS